MKIKITHLTYDTKNRIEYEIYYKYRYDDYKIFYFKLTRNKILKIKRNKHTKETKIYLIYSDLFISEI